MADFRDHGSSAALLESIKDRADDLEKAVIPLKEKVILRTLDGKEIVTHAGIVLYMVDGSFRILQPEDAEIVMNDGLLNRLHVPIEFMKE